MHYNKHCVASATLVNRIIELHTMTLFQSTQHYAMIFPTNQISWFSKLTISSNIAIQSQHMQSIHAEAYAIKKITRKRNLPKSLDIVVIRCSKTGVIGESRPCFHCIRMMQHSHINIKNVYYSTKTGTIKKELLSEMQHSNAHISSGMKFKAKMRFKKCLISKKKS